MSTYSKLAFFVGGTLFGSAGLKILSSKEVKKVYVHAAAAGLRAKDCAMETVTAVQESAADILAEAKALNEARATKAAAEAAESEIQDASAAETAPVAEA